MIIMKKLFAMRNVRSLLLISIFCMRTTDLHSHSAHKVCSHASVEVCSQEKKFPQFISSLFNWTRNNPVLVGALCMIIAGGAALYTYKKFKIKRDVENFVKNPNADTVRNVIMHFENNALTEDDLKPFTSLGHMEYPRIYLEYFHMNIQDNPITKKRIKEAYPIFYESLKSYQLLELFKKNLQAYIENGECISGPSFRLMRASDIEELTAEHIKEIQAVFMRELPFDILKTILLRKDLANAFTLDQLNNVEEPVRNFIKEDVATIIGRDFASLSPAMAFFLLKHENTRQWITNSQLESMTKEQAAQLDGAIITNIDSKITQCAPPVLDEILKNHIESIHDNVLKNIIERKDFSTLSPELLHCFLKEGFLTALITKSQLKAIKEEQIEGLPELNNKMIENFGSKIIYLSPQVIKTLNTKCSVFTSHNSVFFHMKNLSAFSENDLNNLTYETISHFSPELIKELLQKVSPHSKLENMLKARERIENFKKNDDISLEELEKDPIPFDDDLVEWFTERDAEKIRKKSGQQFTAPQLARFSYRILWRLFYNSAVNFTKEQLAGLVPYYFRNLFQKQHEVLTRQFLLDEMYAPIPSKYLSLIPQETQNFLMNENNYIKAQNKHMKALSQKQYEEKISEDKKDRTRKKLDFLEKSKDNHNCKKAIDFINTHVADVKKSFKQHHAQAILSNFIGGGSFFQANVIVHKEIYKFLAFLYLKQGSKTSDSMNFMIETLTDFGIPISFITNIIKKRISEHTASRKDSQTAEKAEQPLRPSEHPEEEEEKSIAQDERKEQHFGKTSTKQSEDETK